MGFLDIDNATKSYGAVEVLHKVDISVEEGEFLVLVGPSGCDGWLGSGWGVEVWVWGPGMPGSNLNREDRRVKL